MLIEDSTTRRKSASPSQTAVSCLDGFRSTSHCIIIHRYLAITDGVGVQKEMAELDLPDQKRPSATLI